MTHLSLDSKQTSMVRHITARPARSISIGISAVFVFLVLLAAVFPTLLASHDPLEINLQAGFQPPSHRAWLGTDQSGRDVYSRVIYGARRSLLVGLGATLLGLIGAILLGLWSGLGGKYPDVISTKIGEILYSFPGILLALLLMAIWGNNVTTQIIAVGLTLVPGYARIIRGQILTVKDSLYVHAAMVQGLSRFHIIITVILPNAFRSLTSLLTLGVGQSIVWSAGLGFLGLGVQPPTPEWGAMLNAGRNYIQQAWWLDFFPGAVIVLFTLALTILGRTFQQTDIAGGSH